MNGTTFRAYAEQILAHAVPWQCRGDGLSAHKGVSVERAIQARDATLLYLSLILRIST